jgi:hypothetical protein
MNSMLLLASASVAQHREEAGMIKSSSGAAVLPEAAP